MTSKRTLVCACAVMGVVVFLWVATILPRTTTALFASPDETAVMLFARAWSPTVGFRLPHRLPRDLADLVGLHPRSTVRQGDALVPVGFLGMPFLVMLAERVFTGLGAYLTALLVLSPASPLWRLARRVSARVAWVTTLIYLTFPTILLYANRGLFPNLPVVAFGLWSVWAFRVVRGPWSVVIGGLTLGLALTIRPTEALWLLPWIAWAIWMSKTTWRRILVACVVTTIVCLGGLWLAYQTYPGPRGWIPPIGYFLRDSTLETVPGSEPALSEVEGFPVPDVSLPFGFHPRVMWRNVWTYFGSTLGPWFAASVLGAVIAVRRRRDTLTRSFILVAGWTVGILLLVYGQAVYTDNIRGSASLANSFLRYMLPLTPLVAFGIALLVEDARTLPKRGTLVATGLVVFFALYGVAVALNGDEESVLNTERQLVRYAEIRRLADENLDPGTVILSERSDKIFASGDFVAVSPFPPPETIDAIVRSSTTVVLFHRTPTGPDATLPGPLALYEFSYVFSVDNESMVIVWH